MPRAGAESALDRVQELVAKARKIPGPARKLAARITAAKADLATLIRIPYNLAAELTGIVNDSSEGLEEPVDALALYRSLASFGIVRPSFLGGTPSELLAEQSLASIESTVRQAAALAGAKVSAAMQYSSRAEALATLDEWEQRLDVGPLQDARAAYVDAMRALAARLPEVSTITVPWPVPALVLANRLYGPSDVAARAAEIARRNRVPNPLWVGGAEAVEVLGV